jgi:hypothetical protein
MITDQDITKLKKVFATKEGVADLSLEVGEMHDKLDLILTKIDGYSGMVQDLRVESGAGNNTLMRHTHEIDALIKHTAVIIPQM